MAPTVRRWLAIAALLGFSGVLLGAFAAHGLAARLKPPADAPEGWLEKRLDQFDVGVRYHSLHAVALLAVLSLSRTWETWARWAARCWLAGIVLFSGSLYLLVLTETPRLGAITPIGGLFLIGGWLAIALGAVFSRNDSTSIQRELR